MRTFLQFLKPYKGLCIITFSVITFDVVAALYIPTLVADMINIGVGGGDMRYIIQKGGSMLAVTILAGVGTLLGSFLCARLSAKIGQDMRNAIYDKSLTFSSYDFDKFGTGSMITRTLNDVNVVQQGFIMTVQMILPVPMMCIIGGLMAFSIDKFMGMILVAMTSIVMVVAYFITRKASFIFEKLQTFLDRINVVLRENITGIRVIRAFNNEKYEEKRMRSTFTGYAQSAIRANRLFFGLESVAIFVINICIVAILWLGGNRVGTGNMQIGDIIALTEYAALILFYVIMAQMVIIMLPRSKVCMGRINEVLLYQPEIVDGVQNSTVEKHEVVCSFKNVYFNFDDADEATIKDLNFTLRRGQTTAIIGSTGSGKSTIAKLILRFHDVTKGSILINGDNVKSISQKDLRRKISYVPQKAWLFSGTIFDNLRYGNENANKEDMEKALVTAQADFVNDLPNKLEARVAQGGINFSGGQKQRLTMARALMKQGDIYIFDDSFSALDFETDAALRDALKSEVVNSAVLIIAQRINTIVMADQIIVLDNGKMVGIGKHSDLIESCDIYRDIVNSQTKAGDLNGK
ncbi:MAG: ABC transporter ATP-binding protein [Oscillospiraceae bacterium]